MLLREEDIHDDPGQQHTLSNDRRSQTYTNHPSMPNMLFHKRYIRARYTALFYFVGKDFLQLQ